MLFDEDPKINLDDLFDREEEIKQFEKGLNMRRKMIVITGHRRVGKTSLLKTIIEKNVKYHVFLDLRRLDQKRNVSHSDITNVIQNGLQIFLDDNKSITGQIKEILQTVKGVNFGDFGIQLEHGKGKELDLFGLFSRIDKWAKQNNEIVVFAIDESQEFRKATHFNMTGLLASIYDNCPNIIMILTGSESGLLYEFIGTEDPKAHLYGRSYQTIHVPPLSKIKSKEFLIKGLDQYAISLKKSPISLSVIDLAVERLGGIIGWLTMFGIQCVEKMEVTESVLDQIESTGANMSRLEFNNYLATRNAVDRYVIIMNTIGNTPATWNTIQTRIEMETKSKIYNSNLNKLLEHLQKAGFIHKEGDKYMITDPLLKISFR